MLTRAGVGAAVVATGMFGAGRLLGAFELFLLGTGVAAIIAVSALATLTTRVRLDAERTLVPVRVHRGAPARVELSVTNTSSRR